MALSDYTELEYIESTGSQFIGIDYIPKTLHTKYELGFMRTGISGYWNPIINSEEDVRFGIMCTIDGNNSSNYGQFHIGPAGRGNFKSVQFPISSNVKYDIVADKTGISLNGTKYSVSGVGDATGSWSTYINHRLTSSTSFSPEYSIGRWYYLKVYEDDNLIRNYIPARRKSDNVLGMYEILEDKFYINSGTGNFIAGPEVFDGSQLQQNLLQLQAELNIQNNELYNVFDNFLERTPYIELEYIKNSSTSTYIDTLIKGTSNIKAEIKIDRLSSTTGSQFFGAWNNSCIMGEVHKSRWDFYIGGTGTSNYKSIGSINDYPTTIIITISNTNLNIKNTSGAQLYNTTYNMGNWNTNLNIHLFGRNTSSGNANSEGIFNIYYCKIWDSNVLVRDLISVKRKSDDEICMYDKVTNQFFTNQGTGNFIAGPEVN